MKDTQDTFRSDFGRFVVGSRLLFKVEIECSSTNGNAVERILVQANAKIRARLKHLPLSLNGAVMNDSRRPLQTLLSPSRSQLCQPQTDL